MARAQKAKATADGGSKDHIILCGAEKTSSHSRNAKAKVRVRLRVRVRVEGKEMLSEMRSIYN